MPIPRLNMPRYKITKSDKMCNIMCELRRLGYDADDAKLAIKIIEDNNLDKSQFDFPYESFEKTKAHVLAGEFDYDDKPFSSSPEEIEALDKAVKEGKLWVTY